MRDEFISGLLEIARVDKRVLLLTADLGFGVLDEYQRELPGQFINVGIAEQNMIGLATGLALEGNIVYCYSIGNFPTLRCLEQIRNDAAYHDANVKIISVGGGLSYGPLGMSHHATEDLAIMRVIPGVSVIVPSNLREAKDSAEYLYNQPGVHYLRLDKSHANYESEDTDFSQWPVLRSGTDVCLISTGGILEEAINAADALAHKGISVRLVSAINLTPNSDDVVLNSIGDVQMIITIEEHVTSGGLGGLVSEIVSGVDFPGRLKRLGVQQEFLASVGSQKYLRHLHGISTEGIVQSYFEDRVG